MTTFPKSLSRRAFIKAGAVVATAAIGGSAAVAGEKDHPSVAFMRKVGKDLLEAHRQGTVNAFLNVIQRYADVPEIALYSLGQYKANLGAAQRPRYFRGVAVFMSRYFADQSREYPIAKYEVGEATTDGKDVTVSSRIFLMSGQTYTVNWRLVWRNKSYKVADAKVLGFSMIYMQRGIFTSYLSKRKGDLFQLMTALEG
ncbi:ABC transporter substrate-binding protein [Taklimakanibacter albus]|jgi:phospholipid transport system substrate-binding protein|uniref:ABC transporter substrate-binding protein n=1 Tax=Taklimakanibacter albus TaxID=2800327 RepID=A0ACC5QYQ2_9HYPH|nr:ABC transporter substrate-binding protein [Aestuariivirga sp. YIM B02566]MBK1865487.1 ABC transporter substrate-binding protein [Aestuariivirga sp. YIM B02566]